LYALGHTAPSVEADWMTAVLACGDDAALSRWPAAALHGLGHGAVYPIDVSSPSGRGRRQRPVTRLDDMRRDNALHLAGELVLHYGRPDVTRHAHRTARQVRRALAERGA
jgi:hypothetical protein